MSNKRSQSQSNRCKLMLDLVSPHVEKNITSYKDIRRADQNIKYVPKFKNKKKSNAAMVTSDVNELNSDYIYKETIGYDVTSDVNEVSNQIINVDIIDNMMTTSDPIIAADVNELSNQIINVDIIDNNMMTTSGISQKIYFKLKFDDEYQEIPQYNRSRKTIDLNKEVPNLNKKRNVLTLSKWSDSQKLKQVLPRDVHDFYNNLPHEQQLKARKTTKV